MFQWNSEESVEEWQSVYVHSLRRCGRRKQGATPAPMHRSVPVSLRHHPHPPRLAPRTCPPLSRTFRLDITLCCVRSFDTLSFSLCHCRIPFTIAQKMHWQTVSPYGPTVDAPLHPFRKLRWNRIWTRITSLWEVTIGFPRGRTQIVRHGASSRSLAPTVIAEDVSLSSPCFQISFVHSSFKAGLRL